MVVISYSGKEANAKIVYYGPGLGGKTTNLEFIYDSVPASSRGKMVSMKTQTDRTLFFDFLPLDLGELGGFKTRFLLYTVPGQVFYNATRKLVLRGVDAVAFIADSEVGKMDENKESLANLVENLAEYDLNLDSIPWVIQYNKRDVAGAYTIEELNRELNPKNAPYFEAVATEGTGVFETFRGLSRLLLEKLSEEIGHRMVISKSFGRKQEQEIETECPEVTPIAKAESSHESDKAGHELAEPMEPETIELASQATQEASDVDSEELEIVSEIVSQEIGPASQQGERVMEPQVEPEPTIAREHEILHGFFSEGVQSASLEKDIVREEVILSTESDLEPPSQVPTAEQVTESKDQPEERSIAQETEQADEQMTADEQTDPLVHEPASEQVTTGDESFFRRMVRRNNVGIFGEHQQEATEHAEHTEHTESPCSSEEPSTDVKSLEQVITIPAGMLQGEKELVITLRLRVKAEADNADNREAPADEFLLDGISR